MLYRPAHSPLVAVRNKFNFALENNLVKKHCHFIIDVELEAAYFDIENNITAEGMMKFWRRICNALKDFDNHMPGASLIPTVQKLGKKCKASARNHLQSDRDRYHLPPPPPNKKHANFPARNR